MSPSHPASNSEAIRMLIAETAAGWYVLHRDGDPSRRQREAFLRWLRASPLHVREYLAISHVGIDLGPVARDIGTSIDTLLADAVSDNSVIALSSRRHGGEQAPRAMSRQRSLAIAAAAALALIGGATALLWSLPRDANTISTHRGEQRTQELADGTLVHLDSDTELVVHFDPSARRVEIRRGQALFEVAKNAARPFSVRVGDATIEDIGTIFDVSTTTANTTVTVVEGRIAIWNRETRERALAAGTTAKPLADLGVDEQATIAPGGVVDVVAGANVRKATAWTRQEIVFDHDSIASVAAEFNRYNRLQVHVDDPAIAAIPVSGVLRAYDVRAFADFLNDLPNVHATIDERQIRVTTKR
jgi:transmembrane sensor